MTRLIALTGPAGSGKSTAAAALAEQGWTRTRFAAPLKAMLAALYAEAGLDAKAVALRIEGGLKEAPCPILAGRTPRHAMQTLGTEWGREMIAPALWVRLWERRARALLDAGVRMVVEDVRFDDEADAVRSLGGLVVALERPRLAWSGAHVSEAGVAADVAVVNACAPEELARAISLLAPPP